MKKRKKKLKIDKYFIRRLILLTLIILLMLGIYNILFKRNKKIPELSFLYNNSIIEPKDKVIIENNSIIYLSKEDVKDIFDDNIYYNEAEEELITAYNKHVALLKKDENYMMVNDSHIDLNGKMQEIDEKLYLPLNDLSIVYDIEVNYSEKNNRVIVDSTSKSKIEAKVSKKVKVKASSNIFSKKIENINKDEKICVLEHLKKYSKIRTLSGNIGYIKTKYIYEENKVRDDWVEESKEINILNEYKKVSSNYQNLSLDKEKLNVVSPVMFFLEEDSKVLDKSNSSSDSFKNYLNWANTNEISIIPEFTNNGSVSKNMLTYSQRNKVINQLYELVVTKQLKGININFETIDDINSFYRFIIELTPKFRESGLKVCLTLNKNINKEKIDKVVDYIIEEKK